MSDRIEIHVRADTIRGVPIALMAAIGKALNDARDGAIFDGACDCCNFRFIGGGT
jgi:hypothetical protein